MEVEFMSHNSTPIKQKGIEISVTNTEGKGGNRRGTLTVTMTKLVWTKSGASVNTKELDWEDFIKMMEGL